MPTACHHLPCGSHPAGVAPRALSSEIIARVGVALDGSASERDARTAHHTTQRQQPHHHCPSPPHPPPPSRGPRCNAKPKPSRAPGACASCRGPSSENARKKAAREGTRPDRIVASCLRLARCTGRHRTNERTNERLAMIAPRKGEPKLHKSVSRHCAWTVDQSARGRFVLGDRQILCTEKGEKKARMVSMAFAHTCQVAGRRHEQVSIRHWWVFQYCFGKDGGGGFYGGKAPLGHESHGSISFKLV